MKCLSAETIDFSTLVRAGDCVAWGQAGAEPVVITRALLAQRHRVGQFSVFIGMTWSDSANPEYADCVRFRTYCGAAENRHLVRAGVLDVLPCHYSQLSQMIRSGQLKVDVVLLQLAPADAAGRYSLSIAHEYLIPAIDSARLIIAEINAQAPWTYGERFLTEKDIHVAIHTDRQPVQHLPAESTAVEAAVASRVANLIEDESTLQVGIGALPGAVLRKLMHHRGLGIHTGALTDEVAILAEHGVVTNAYKSIDRGTTVAGVMMGSRTVYDYADRNDRVRFRSIDYTHSPAVLAEIDKLVAINSAIEVDLTGQINSETIGGLYVGAVGGALDFLRGASRSKGGVPIIALPSTAGKIDNPTSRIVARLSGPATTPRSDAGFIVTEHGAADMRGLSIDQRIEKMLTLADPRFRAELSNKGSRAAAEHVRAPM